MKRSTVLREIRDTATPELKDRLRRLEADLFKFRMRRATNQLENTMQIRLVRREIAQVLTVLSEREHKVQTPAQAEQA